jgi:general secretion pathway protein G
MVGGIKERAMVAVFTSRTSVNRASAAFTLVEVLIVVVILGILAGIVIPIFSDASLEAKAKSTAANVRIIRELIAVHQNSGEYTLSTAGWPDDIYPAWFKGAVLPDNAWTNSPINVDVVALGSDDFYPADKTFDQYDGAAVNAWYNTDNGRFIMLVPAQATDPETLALFNMANAANATALNQTTR